MIKSLRYLTKVLGKLDAACSMVHDHGLGTIATPRYSYGMGLKAAKDFVEAYCERMGFPRVILS